MTSCPIPDKETDPIEAVPTGIIRVGEEYYVTLFGGCPYPDGSGLLVAVDEQRNQRTVRGWAEHAHRCGAWAGRFNVDPGVCYLHAWR